jgi:two-component system, sensor histidine kinase and response regulator
MMTKILVIEDETILREEIMEWLTLEDYEVFGAADGMDGIQQAFAHHPDLIICDITMPRLDGHGVLLELHANPATAAIPFIFVTARAAHEDIRKGMSLGADDYITKPFTRLELLGAIQSRLDKQAAFEHKHQAQVDDLHEALTQEHERRRLTTKLVAMFSHDFRTPLAVIRASTSMLRDYGQRMDADRQNTHFSRVEASVNQLLQMLDDMLVVAQMEIGKLVFQPEPLNLEQFFQEIVTEFEAIHGETHTVTYTSTVTGNYQADSRLLHQIATNLIANAVKYSPQRSTVHITLQGFEGYVEFKVQDNGIGIPEADQLHIFDSFQRASNVGTITGTGLGLAIVREAVTHHQGTVSLKSQLGVGTTVTVRIPF